MYENLNNLLIQLCRAISTRKLYFTEHPKVKSLSSDFINQLRDFCAQTNIKKLFIGIIDENLVFEGRNLVGPSIVGRQLIVFAEKLHCGGFSFAARTTLEEFNEFLNLVTELNQPTGGLKLSRQLLTSRKISNIELAQQYAGPAGPMGDKKSVWHGEDAGNFVYSPTLIYQALYDTVAQAYGDVASGQDIDIDSTRSVSEYMLHFTRTHFADLMQHVHYPDYDSYTVGHSVRVAALAVYIAHSFNWGEHALLAIGTAGLLHDIGKCKTPDDILFKPGKLDNQEFDIIMEHSRLGAEILLSQKNATNLDIAAAWGHHIRYDGSGYPLQPKWAMRHPFTSLLQICDAFEALTAVRPYKPLLTPHMAYSIMLKDKGGFHPPLLASFISVIGIYPPGNKVRISNGAMGTVIGVGKTLDRPSVKITHNEDGDELPQEDQYLIDLDAVRFRDLQVDELLIADVATDTIN